MDKPKVFIDGREGTTGLQLWERLSRRTDLELLRIGEARRKDPAERKKYLNAADLVFLCLPDAAAWEAVGLIENGHTRIIDASTAHRTASGMMSRQELEAFEQKVVSVGWLIPAATPPASWPRQPPCPPSIFCSGTAPSPASPSLATPAEAER